MFPSPNRGFWHWASSPSCWQVVAQLRRMGPAGPLDPTGRSAGTTNMVFLYTTLQTGTRQRLREGVCNFKRGRAISPKVFQRWMSLSMSYPSRGTSPPTTSGKKEGRGPEVLLRIWTGRNCQSMDCQQCEQNFSPLAQRRTGASSTLLEKAIRY